MANIKVAVRVRPISAREINLTGSEVVVRTDLSGISLTNVKVSSSKAGDSRERTRRYGFDYCFDSSNIEAEGYADQAKVYETLGQTVLDAVFLGYNSCLVAYGQSASGKTYTMMGTKDEPGLTPRLCEGLFSRIVEEKKSERVHRITVSYLEIYNERVRDLLKPSATAGGLKVREHPRLGPYVQGLTHHVVRTLGSLMSYVEEGTKARKTASTLQNPSSSRSHALLTIAISPESPSVSTAAGHPGISPNASTGRKENSPRGGSKLHLVDLAGSESAATCSGIHRLKEGANINKSLVALGNVISALAERGSTGSGPGRRFIPYRDSSLTWLLKDALGGNATTIMLATISPASGSYNETAHTLRFAQRAQSVVNRPVVNEDPVERIIRELRAEVARLKSLLLEKNIEPDCKVLCSCKKTPSEQEIDDRERLKLNEKTVDSDKDTSYNQSKDETKLLNRKADENNSPSIRRFNSSESLANCESSIKRFGSCEYLGPKDRFRGNYNRARVTELNDEEDEVSEINESVFVDIPTLVAVLIKPDDSLQESSTQIEEICSDEVAEDSIDVDFIESDKDRRVFEDQEKSESIEERSSSVNSYQTSADTDINDVYQTTRECPLLSKSIAKINEKSKFRKQDSIDMVTPTSNLDTSKRFGSVEAIQKKKEPIFSLERSNTNLERRSVGSDKAKKLNNIREIDDRKVSNRIGNTWRGNETNGSKELLQRKGSNDSDKSLKDSNGQSVTKATNHVRKPSLENLKRKTSKDSSSSSSKEEQILISNLTRDKLLRRKSSLEQEPPTIRAHTPIQRVKRAEIVAAVTERLYSSRKHTEDNTASGIRSPPEGTELRAGSVFGARTKLQEISRKMLGKRRRVCVDTQTESSHTVRVKDSACLTEMPSVICQDAAVLTDDHENCEIDLPRVPVLRVKEIATSTDKSRTNIVRCKDVGSLANDLEDYDYEIHSPRNDSGILSDDTQNYAESNLSSAEVSDLSPENDRRVVYTESSTNTIFSPLRTSAVQTPQQERTSRQTSESKTPCVRQCCNSVQEPCSNIPVSNAERNVISISLPDMINITIESTNVLESRIAVMDSVDSPEEKVKSSTKDREVQTNRVKDFMDEAENRFCFKDFTRSITSQTDGRGFRIENIFQDPNNIPRNCSKIDVADQLERVKNSVTFTNSLGTLYVADSKENVEDIEDDKIQGELSCDLRRRGSFVKDGLITKAFISKKRNVSLSPRRPQSIVYNDPWKNWMSSSINSQSIDYERKLGIISSFWQENNEVPVTGLPLSCINCNSSGSLRNNQVESELIDFKQTTELNAMVSPARLEPISIPDHDHSFSDDSLDYNENNVPSESVLSGTKKEECESRENLCPPDVVAHTKKDTSKPTNTVDAEASEPALSEFENSHVEFPKKKLNDAIDHSKIHDYKSLILGSPNYTVYESVTDESDSSNCVRPAGKKKVSFSNISTTEKKDRQVDQKRNADSNAGLKSIIKKKTNPSDSSNGVKPSNQTDSLQDQNNLPSESNYHPENDQRGTAQSSTSEKTPTQDQDSNHTPEKSTESITKKVKFSKNLPETRSESTSPGKIENETNSPDRSTRNILEEYLDEAVIFMRNMNSINEYMTATKMFDKHLGRNKRRGSRRRNCTTWDKDYVEFQGRRISLKDDTEEDLNEEDIVLPTESYERCLKGIERLESCIEKVDKQNVLLREKYGINCESTGARLNLASPSIDVRLFPTMENDSVTSRRNQYTFGHRLNVPTDSLSSRSFLHTDLTNGNSADDKNDEETMEDDIEKRIFDQLMNVADSTCYWNSNKLREGRFTKVSDIGSRSPMTYLKFGEKFNQVGREPFPRDIRGTLNSVESSGDDFKELERYNTIDKSYDGRLGLLKIEDEFDSMDEDLMDRTSGSIDCWNNRGRMFEDRVPLTSVKHGDSQGFKLSLKTGMRERIEEDDSLDKLCLKSSISFPVQRASRKNCREKIHELDEFRRRIRDDSRGSYCEDVSEMENSTESITTNVQSMEEMVHLRDKLKYPGSPRAKFLELLRERRRIVESSRGTSAS